MSTNLTIASKQISENCNQQRRLTFSELNYITSSQNQAAYPKNKQISNDLSFPFQNYGCHKLQILYLILKKCLPSLADRLYKIRAL